MKNKMVTDMHIDELETCDWLTYEDVNGEEHFIRTDEDVANAARNWNVSSAMVKSIRTALDFMTSAIVLDLKEDLQDIWNTANCAHNNALTAMAILSPDESEDDESDYSGDESWGRV